MNTTSECTEKENENENDATSNLHTITDWEDLEVSEDILRSIYAYGYEKPSPIQRT